MSKTAYPLQSIDPSPYQFLVQREETFFVDKLSLIVDNKPVFQWNVGALNLKGTQTFTVADKEMELHWHWGWSGQPISFNVYHQGTTIAKYTEPNPHGMVESSQRYMVQKLGLPMSNRVTDPNKNSWSFTVTALFIIFGIHGFIIGWQIFKRDFQLGEFLIFAALTTIGFTFLGFLIDLARIQWRRFRNKS